MTTTALPHVSDTAGENRPAVAAPSTSAFRITAKRLRVWGIRSALSILDQGLTAGVGFVVNIALARWLPAEAYGAFAVAFAAFLFISGFHNVLLLEPLTVMGPSRHANRLPTYFRKQIAIHVRLVGMLGAVILLASSAFWWLAPNNHVLVGALIGSGLALPFVTLLWLIRRMCYVLQKPAVALLGSGSYVVFVLSGLFLLRHFESVDPLSAFGLMSIGSLVSAWVLWHRLGLAETPVPVDLESLSWREVARENWSYGRWLVGSTALNSVSTQAQMFLAATSLGLGAAGVLRAMQIPSLVMTHILSATGLLILPAFSYDFGNGFITRLRRKATLASVGLAAGTLAFTAVLAGIAPRTEHLLYGGKYAEYAWLIPLLTLVPVAQGAAMGYSMALRAMHRPKFDLIANAIAAPLGVISAIALMHWWGLAGAAASMVLSYATYAIVSAWMYRSTKQIAPPEMRQR